jgi:2-polyprenyl-3-methyl-5-hydroxy-6-metoxy-1,4-benzoquinol methylase
MKMKKQYEMKELDGTNGKIMVGIPRERIYIPIFVDNRDALLASLQDAGRADGYIQHESHRVDRNRDFITEWFMSRPSKPEWLLMIDTDMEHPPDVGIRLTKWNKPIVGALYFHRGQTHEPFVFKYTGPEPDRWGRDTKKWQPLRDEVYNFLEAHRLPMRDSSMVINNPLVEPLIEVDAVATGSMIIHRSVFEIMDAPWWEYQTGGNSEDLLFCYHAKEHGIPIHADLSTICGHYSWVPMGQAQFRQLYLARGVQLTTYAKAEAVEMITEFLGIAKDEADIKVTTGNAHLVGDYWKSYFGGKEPSDKEVRDFYKMDYVGQLYLIELIHWNFTQAFANIRQMVVPIREKNVLEIGGGIGSVAMQLAIQKNNVVTAEINPLLRDFIKYRWEKLHKDITSNAGELYVIGSEWTKESKDNMFDVVISFDTFEHLTANELQKMLGDLHRVLKPGGRMIYHNNFKQQDIYPLHFDHSELWDTWLIQNGFMPTSEFEAVKIK